jgi:CubicO group peptidase (beta-lactamase class C family)
VAGERRLGSADWATIADGFDVASCAKSITAAIAAMLVASGQVRWDTTVEQAFPQLADSILPIYRKVTLDMLLRHRSGLARWMSTNERWAAWHRDHISKSAIEKRRLFVAKVFSDPPRAAPGTETYYVNDGYVVAAAMLEAATGRPWEAYVRDVLFAPMSLESMRYGVPVRGEDRGVVWGHAPRSFSGPLAMRPDPDEYGDPPFGSPAGFLYSTVPDLLRYLDLHIQGANGASALLGREEFDYLHTPLAGERFALGWEVETTRDADGRVLERSIYHGGFSGRARANLWFSPESRSGTVIVYNYGGDEKADAYAAIFFALLKEFATPIQSTPSASFRGGSDLRGSACESDRRTPGQPAVGVRAALTAGILRGAHARHRRAKLRGRRSRADRRVGTRQPSCRRRQARTDQKADG